MKMSTPEEDRDHLILLRQRAEEALRGSPVDLDGLPVADIQYLLHELQVHQAELSLQNEELRRVHLELESARDLYSDLYNFAPTGYCTLSRKDTILEANQTLAALLGVEQEKLINLRLSQFIDHNSQDEYYLYRQRAFQNHQHQTIRIHMVKQNLGKIKVRIESKTAHNDENKLLVVISDITKQEMIEKDALEAALLRELQYRLTNQREQERQQLARDLHDGPLQGMIAINFALKEIISNNSNPEFVPQLVGIEANLKELIKELREHAVELRPPLMANFGLEKTIRSHAEKFQEGHPEVIIQLEMHQTGPILNEIRSLALFRIYQEALRNIVKHVQCPGTQVHIFMEKDEHQVRLEIQDNGPGFDLPEQWIDLIREDHLGLVGMRERAEAVGGRLEIYSKQGGGGTKVVVIAPSK